jgi:hypothetical protein
MIVVGDGTHPDGAIVCRACAALPTEEQKRRRDAAMARRLTDAVDKTRST